MREAEAPAAREAEARDEVRRARLFVALPVPEGVQAELVTWSGAAIRDAGPRSGEGADRSRELRAVEAEALHITLCFLGWRPVSEVDRIARAVGPVVEEADSLEDLCLGEPAWLGGRRPRILAVTVSDPSGALARLQAAIAAALVAIGAYAPERRPFLAHVTVARASRSARLERRGLAPPRSAGVRGSEVVLYRSWAGSGRGRGPGGVRYQPLGRWRVGG